MVSIEKLTKEQEDLLPVFRNQWTTIGLSTQPTDRIGAEQHIKAAYIAGGLPPPECVVWVQGPLQGVIASAILEQYGQKKQANNLAKNKQCQAVAEIVAAALHLPKKGLLDSVTQADLQRQTSKVIFGLHDANWLGFYDFFGHIGLEEIVKPLTGLKNLAKCCGWCWAYDKVCIMSDRPNRLIRDDSNRLHCENGPALTYPSGQALYAWHGVRVSEQIIMRPETLTAEMALKENNQEIRRVILGRYGWGRLLKDLSAKEIHRDQYGILYETNRLGEYLNGEDPVAKFVEVVDPSTSEHYWLRVDPKSETAHAGVASTYRKTQEEYNPIVRT